MTRVAIQLACLAACVIHLVAAAAAAEAASSLATERVVFIAGGRSHGYGEHEYRAGARLLATAVEEAGLGLDAEVYEGWPEDPHALEGAAAVVLSMDGRGAHLALDHLDELDALARRGAGILALHWAVHVPRGEAGRAFERWIGGYYETGYSTNPKWDAELALDPAHPVARGVHGPVRIHDEWYFRIRFPEPPRGASESAGPGRLRAIATAVPTDDDRARVSAFWPWAAPPDGVARESGRRETLVWSLERPDGGRGLGFTGGHYHWNLGNDAFRTLLLNAIVWVAGRDVPRDGVASRTPTFDELRAGQDEREPWGFDADAVRERFGLAVAAPSHVPLERFHLPDDLEIRVFAESPLLYNPTNIDVDASGRVWVAEGWNYRGAPGARAAGDRIVVLEDRDGDGAADASHVFVQDPSLDAPLGIAVVGNRVLVSMAPALVEYTDVDGDLRFDPRVDRRRVLLDGFAGHDSDHALHAVVVGPDGAWYGSFGNDGADVVDGDGRRFRFKGRGDAPDALAPASDDGRVYVGGASFRFDPSPGREQRARAFEVVAHNLRNSYEQAFTSAGELFQNDNDDGDASRTTWVMEHANAGFASNDGTRTWVLDRRPDEPVASAHWRQRDPGIAPAGDVYGSGAPTGIVVNEGDGLGPRYRGAVISADAALETLLAYRPVARGAGFELASTRFDLVTTNPTRELAGTDVSRGERATGLAGYFVRKAMEARGRGAQEAWFEPIFRALGLDRRYVAPAGADPVRFRPSDVAIGPDGALYVADWLDAYVGGSTMADAQRLGAVYRIARRGEPLPRPAPPDVGAIDGAVRALRSPAVHVRALGFDALRREGARAAPVVRALLDDPDPFVRARAVWLLPSAGLAARARALVHEDAALRVAAYRALRRAGEATTGDALAMARSGDAAARREAALAMRARPWSEAREVLLELVARLDADDRTELEALGAGADGKERELYAAAAAREPADATAWSAAMAALAWRLHPPEAVPALRVRALSPALDAAARERALDALAFTPAREAALALRDATRIADAALARRAAWWLDRNATTHGLAFGVGHDLEPQYDPALYVDFRALADAGEEERARAARALGSAEELAARPADAARGADLFARGAAPCRACHAVGGEGGAIGPDLGEVGARLSRREILARMLAPTSDLMPSAAALGLAPQDAADLAAFLARGPLRADDASAGDDAIRSQDAGAR
ncbi:MAG: ThuA domain-containing protein [Myxococcota bacterium]